MFNHVDYDDIIDDLYQNQLKTLCCVSFLYMLLRGLTYRSLLHSYFALIIFSFIQEYGVSYIKNDINNRFKKLFHKFITNKTLEEDSVEEVIEDVVVEEVVKKEVSVEEVSVEEGSKDEVSAEEGSAEEGSVEEVSVEEGSMVEGSVEEGSVVEGSVVEGSMDSYTLRKRQILRDC